MHIVKHFATQRGVKSLSFREITMPVELALEEDQMAPLLVASAAYTFAHSGLFGGTADFPWVLAVEPDNEVALLNGTVVRSQATVLPQSVGYLFLDYEFERLVAQHMMQNDLTEAPEVLPVDTLLDRLEMMESEPEQFKRVPFSLTV